MDQIDKDAILRKLLAMFRPCEGAFLDFDPKEVICGPNDRALVGFDTYFPKEQLIEDHDFTAAEADFIIKSVAARL